ncbi:MAG: phosphoglucosamine mutase, partial [Bacteroidota bacterium]
MALIKSISGIRGTIGGVPGQSLTAIDIVKFTASYGNIIAERREDKSSPT